jgi:hypothetical protein
MVDLFYFDINGEIGIEPGFNGKKKNSFYTEMLRPSSGCC